MKIVLSIICGVCLFAQSSIPALIIGIFCLVLLAIIVEAPSFMDPSKPENLVHMVPGSYEDKIMILQEALDQAKYRKEMQDYGNPID